MGVGSPNGADAAAEIVAHGNALAGSLGMHIHKDYLGIYLFKNGIDHHKGVVGVCVHGVAAQQVYDANIAETGLADGIASAGAAGSKVCGTDNVTAAVQIVIEFTAVPCVVSQSDDVCAGGKKTSSTAKKTGTSSKTSSTGKKPSSTGKKTSSTAKKTASKKSEK